jgi:predicted secreted protein
MEHPQVKDARSGRIMFVSHCCLNQNAKVRGIAKYPGTIRPLFEMLLDANVGIYQLPCPEMTYLGAMRWGQVKDQYDSPMFRRHCSNLAATVIEQAEEYLRSGHQILGFIMMDGSPVCGLNRSPQPSDPDLMWGGMTWYLPEQIQTDQKGVFCEILFEATQNRSRLAEIPFVAHAEAEEIRSDEQVLAEIRALL